LPCDALSAFLAFCGRVVYPSHHSASGLFGLSPLQDQECAGALMWFWVTIAYLLPAIVITVRMCHLRALSSGPRPQKTLRFSVEQAWFVQKPVLAVDAGQSDQVEESQSCRYA